MILKDHLLVVISRSDSSFAQEKSQLIAQRNFNHDNNCSEPDYEVWQQLFLVLALGWHLSIGENLTNT